MDDLIPLISRWVHVGTTIVLVGGSVFMRFVLGPAAATLPDAEHQALREKVVGTWKRFVHAGILLFLLSGFYNYIAVTMPKHDGDSRYHMLMGIKIILAIAVFFIGSALVGKSAAFQKLRDNRAQWLTILIVLAALIVGIAGFLKIRGTPVVEEANVLRTPAVMISAKESQAWVFTRPS